MKGRALGETPIGRHKQTAEAAAETYLKQVKNQPNKSDAQVLERVVRIHQLEPEISGILTHLYENHQLFQNRSQWPESSKEDLQLALESCLAGLGSRKNLTHELVERRATAYRVPAGLLKEILSEKHKIKFRGKIMEWAPKAVEKSKDRKGTPLTGKLRSRKEIINKYLDEYKEKSGGKADVKLFRQISRRLPGRGVKIHLKALSDLLFARHGIRVHTQGQLGKMSLPDEPITTEAAARPSAQAGEAKAIDRHPALTSAAKNLGAKVDAAVKEYIDRSGGKGDLRLAHEIGKKVAMSMTRFSQLVNVRHGIVFPPIHKGGRGSKSVIKTAQKFDEAAAYEKAMAAYVKKHGTKASSGAAMSLAILHQVDYSKLKQKLIERHNIKF